MVDLYAAPGCVLQKIQVRSRREHTLLPITVSLALEKQLKERTNPMTKKVVHKMHWKFSGDALTLLIGAE